MRYLMFLIVGLMLVFSAAQGTAQGVGTLLTQNNDTPSTSAAHIDKIMERAAANGVGVVVIDTQGNFLANPRAENDGPPTELESEMSPLMAAQERAVRFRTALVLSLIHI